MPKLRVRGRIGQGGAGEIGPVLDGSRTPSSTRPVKGHPSGTVAASEVARRVGVPLMSPSWLKALRPAWRGLVGWSARASRSYGPTGSSGRQPEPRVRVRGMSTAAGPGGGAALEGASVAPPPLFSPVEPAPTAPPDSPEHSQRPADAGPGAQPANGPLPATRQRVVLLQHARPKPTDTRPNNRRADGP